MLFQPLPLDEVRVIALNYLEELTSTLQRWNKSLTIDPRCN